jgi:hypothetical protein
MERMSTFQVEVQRVKDYVRSAILRAELPEGAPVHEELLRNSTGASHRAVQEALRDLAREGLIWRKRHAGTKVSERLPSVICAVLPPVRSVGIVSAYNPGDFSSIEYCQDLVKGIRGAMQPPVNIVEYFKRADDRWGLDNLPAVDVETAKRSVQGLIAIEATDARALNDLVRMGLPLIAIDFWTRESLFDATTVDHIQAGFEATNHLLNLGHRRIAYIGEGATAYSSDPAWQDRLTGYLRAMAIRSGADSRTWILDVRRRIADVGERLPEFHRTHNPSAYVAGGGEVARVALQVLCKMGCQCPLDISIVSASYDLAIGGRPRISHVYVNYEEFGRSAVRLLASRLACRPMPPVRTTLQGVFVPADSTASPNNVGRSL